jgi:hypothetical protein
MGRVLPTIEAYQVHHLPIVKAYADTMGFVEVIHQVGPTAMALDPGTIGLGMRLETLRGRRPLYRLEAVLAHHDTALLLGQARAPGACDADTVGRVFDRLSDTGTMQGCTACAVRAAQVLRFDTRSVHFATTAVRVSGDDVPPEARQAQEHTVPCTMT